MAYDTRLADRIRSILQDRPGYTERKMFGGLAFMINGHMCCGVVKTDLMLRLTEEAVTKALHETHTRPMDFSGKPMRTMVYVDARGTDSEAALHSWVENAYAHAFTLPPKPVKPKSRE